MFTGFRLDRLDQKEGDFLPIGPGDIRDTVYVYFGEREHETVYRLTAADDYGDRLILGYSQLPTAPPTSSSRFEVHERDHGVVLSWSTAPKLGEEGVLGYRLYRTVPDSARTPIGPPVIRDTALVEVESRRDARYVLAGAYDLGDGWTSAPRRCRRGPRS
mgnify:CR=1 FL=1